ncbi:hypothetical protein LCGC14_1890240 [marine sediment metagenome]|uniref:HNH nuclease domain-containing protein n=1 Tax=marine sediment metagenome TaxID=412755 RepID=A0A0F9FZN8_9ZZZZ
MHTCTICQKKYTYNYKDTKGHTKTKCNSCLANQRRFRRKERALEYKGRKCEICSYDKCRRALNFHHKDETKKNFGISGAHTRSWDEIQKELDKCTLVCSNCHMEIHAKLENYTYSQNLKIPEPEKKIRKTRKCQRCDKEFKVYSKSTRFCSQKCYRTDISKAPEKHILEELVWSIPSTQLAKQFGVSDTAIKKWCRKYGIKKPGRGYWRKIETSNPSKFT